MKLKRVAESFPGQPEVKDMTVAVDVPFAEANKDHDEKIKQSEEAFKANKDAMDLVDGDKTKNRDGKVKNANLKKMHLSEHLFEDMFDQPKSLKEEFTPEELEWFEEFGVDTNSATPYKDCLVGFIENPELTLNDRASFKDTVFSELLKMISDDDARKACYDMGLFEDLNESCRKKTLKQAVNEEVSDDEPEEGEVFKSFDQNVWNKLKDIDEPEKGEVFKHQMDQNAWNKLKDLDEGCEGEGCEELDEDTQGDRNLDNIAKKIVGDMVEDFDVKKN